MRLYKFKLVIFTFCSFLICQVASAKGFSLGVGSLINWHPLYSTYYLRNKLTNNGRLVYSPIMIEAKIGIRLNYISIFATTDSIASPTSGIAANYLMETFSGGERFRTYLMGGIRFVNSRKWREISGIAWSSQVPLIGIRNDTVLIRFVSGSSLEFNTYLNPLQSTIGIFYFF